MSDSQKKSDKEKTGIEAVAKGRLAEFIVASMYDAPGVNVQRNVRLPAIRGKNKRFREIDVLVSKIGCPTRFAIECKNYREAIGVEKIDEFGGKLKDVGIPTNCGIYVTVRSFTKDARDLAADYGIKLLLLRGLTEDRMASLIHDAMQSVIYLQPNLLCVSGTSVINEATLIKNAENTLRFCFSDAQGNTLAVMPDAIWDLWMREFIPSAIGTYKIEFPDVNWYRVQNGIITPVRSVTTIVGVQGIVVSFLGKSLHHSLIDAEKKHIAKHKMQTSFDIQEGTYPVTTFHTETALEEHLINQGQAVKLATRVRLPRIWFDSFYWPLSKKAEGTLKQRSLLFDAKKLSSFYPEDRTEIEGGDLQSVWESISPNYWMTAGEYKSRIGRSIDVPMKIAIEPIDSWEPDEETGFPKIPNVN